MLKHPRYIRRRKNKVLFGDLNGHVIGIVMKECVRRATESIQGHRFDFETRAKGANDFVTTADKAAQKIYRKLIEESFPSYGLVGEEDNLLVECSHPHHDIWFTVDPLDGTKAFVRMQSHGVGTMIALICDGEVVAAYVGDPLTREMYGYRPGSTNVHRITSSGIAKKLNVNPRRKLKKQFLLLRDSPGKLTPHARRLFEAVNRGNRKVFKDYQIADGSIGVSMARLWKCEVAGTIFKPGKQTPWDMAPIIGISEKLGFMFLKIDPQTGEMSRWRWQPTKEVIRTEHEIFVVHKSRLNELRKNGFKIKT